MKRITAFLLAALAALSLTACGGGDTGQTTTAVPETTAPTQVTTLPPETDPPTDPPTEPPTEPSAVPSGFTNPLNGEPIGEALCSRPYAVAINNIRSAQPLCGVGQADMLIEALTEGGITRLLAVYTDISDVEHLGSVRSSRPCFISLARAFDAIYVHAGGSDQAYDILSKTGIDHLDGIRAASGAFYRDQARLNAGYSLEHTLFTEGADLIAKAKTLGCTLTRTAPIDYGYQFSDGEALTAGESAQKITVKFQKNGKTTSFTFDSDTGCYHAAQYGSEIVDGNTNEAVTFANVLVIQSKTTSDGKYTFMELTGTGKGWFASGGKMIPITWSRSGETAPFVFTGEDGNPITFAAGHTYLGVIPTSSTASFQ